METEGFAISDTALTQETPKSEVEPEKAVKFPKHIKFRGKDLATIYRPSASYPNYRVAWTAGGRRMMKGFHRYGDAKSHADQLVKDLAKGSQVTALTPGQANDALAALERLHGFYEATGRRVSLLAGISEYCDAAVKLAGRPLSEAVDGFLTTVATVKRVEVGTAIEEFIQHRRAKTVAENGKRPRLSPEQFYLTGLWLREFARAFPGNCVSDLTKQHLDLYMAQHGKAAPKTRNERRAIVRMFLKWATVQDYLKASHRLLEATDMQPEDRRTRGDRDLHRRGIAGDAGTRRQATGTAQGRSGTGRRLSQARARRGPGRVGRDAVH